MAMPFNKGGVRLPACEHFVEVALRLARRLRVHRLEATVIPGMQAKSPPAYR